MEEDHKKILVIEDNRDTVAVIMEELVERGFAVSLARNGREGFTAT